MSNDTQKSAAPKAVEKATAKRPIKLQALTRLYYDERIVEEGEVYLYHHDELPADWIAEPADPDARVGAPAPAYIDRALPKEPPVWTTKGYVDKANRAAGRRSQELTKS